MATFDEDDLKEIVTNIKTDLVQLDATIEELIKEAVARNGSNNIHLVYHDLANPLSRLVSTKQKSVDQLIKIIEKYVHVEKDETEFDLEDLYSNFEEPHEEEQK